MKYQYLFGDEPTVLMSKEELERLLAELDCIDRPKQHDDHEALTVRYE